jgi:hypothetical protein
MKQLRPYLILLVLLGASGCATTMPSPKVGACVVYKQGDWRCLDDMGIPANPNYEDKYVCHKYDEWAALMRFCKK